MSDETELQPDYRSVDSQAKALRTSFRNMIVEADEWRPLANHIKISGHYKRNRAFDEAQAIAERYGAFDVQEAIKLWAEQTEEG